MIAKRVLFYVFDGKLKTLTKEILRVLNFISDNKILVKEDKHVYLLIKGSEEIIFNKTSNL